MEIMNIDSYKDGYIVLISCKGTETPVATIDIESAINKASLLTMLTICPELESFEGAISKLFL
jgi:hypothetical protein